MPVSKAFVDATAETLSAVRPVTFKKMFGGTGYYCDAVFFAVGDDDRLFFKVDDETRPKYLDLGMEVWICAGEENHSYREVPDLILKDATKLGEWIDDAIQAAIRLKRKKK